MGRKIGNYTNPTTGETDWLEPDTVNMIILQPKMITKVGETSTSPIDFKLDNIDAEQVITITAEYTTGGKKYISNPVKIEELTFADQFADKVYADKALDEAICVINAKETAAQDLTKKLMKDGIMTGGMNFNGLGFVIVDGDKVLSIESIEYNYAVNNNKPEHSAIIKNCVGQASLKNLDNPVIKFYTGEYEIELKKPKVVTDVEGRVKTYNLSLSDIKIVPSKEMPQHEKFGTLNLQNEDFLEKFLKSRRALLDDKLDRDDDLDDFIDGLFD